MKPETELLQTELLPVVDVTQEFFEMSFTSLNRHIRDLGEGVLVGISYQIFDEDGLECNRGVLRKTKAMIERGPGRFAVVVASEEQVAIEPNVFCSGVTRMSPDIQP